VSDQSIEAKPSLPTYATVADVLEKKNGSGVRLLGWTFARAALIAPPFLVVGVSPKKAFAGAMLASGLISLFTLLRIYNAGFEQEWAEAQAAKRGRRLRPRTY
jgi:hypothetical protein